MQLEDLKAQYDQLQLQYGAKELTSIYNGGYTDNPVYYPIGNGMMNIEKAIEDMKFIVKQIEFI